jgi:hypothetical protein
VKGEKRLKESNEWSLRGFNIIFVLFMFNLLNFPSSKFILKFISIYVAPVCIQAPTLFADIFLPSSCEVK